MLLRRLSFYLALAGIAGGVYLVMRFRSTPPPPPLPVEPARSPFADSVAATGIIEAARENVKVATSRAGYVIEVPVTVGTQVKKGDPLFRLDDRQAQARVQLAEAELEALKTTLALEEIQLADITDQLASVRRLASDAVASEDELKRKNFQVDGARQRLAKAHADIRVAESSLASAKVELDVLTVRAPREGKLLQITLRAGEYANISPAEPLMILGDVETLQIRADVDEQNAPLIRPNQPAVAFLKGSTQKPLPLRFVRIEPFVIPKRSLTGDSVERVDTRVLQIIYAMDQPAAPLYVGQQVDVFIRKETSAEAPPAPSDGTPTNGLHQPGDAAQ